MSLLLRNGLKFSQKLLKIVRSRIWNFVLKVKEYSLCSGNCDGILALVLFDKLPKGIGTVLLLEGNGHDLVLLDLGPLNSIYFLFMFTLVFLEVNVGVNNDFVGDLSLRKGVEFKPVNVLKMG